MMNWLVPLKKLLTTLKEADRIGGMVSLQTKTQADGLIRLCFFELWDEVYRLLLPKPM